MGCGLTAPTSSGATARRDLEHNPRTTEYRAARCAQDSFPLNHSDAPRSTRADDLYRSVKLAGFTVNLPVYSGRDDGPLFIRVRGASTRTVRAEE